MASRTAHNIQGEVTPEWSRTIPSLPQLKMQCLTHPRTGLTLAANQVLAAKALPTHIPLAIDQDPQGPFHGAAVQPLFPSLQCIHRAAPPQVQH